MTAKEIKIDGYAHISPPKYTEFIRQKYPVMYNNMLGACPPLYDLNLRFQIMDQYEGLLQVLTIGPVPSIEDFAGPSQTVELARMANDEMAELLNKYRNRFVAAIALLPMNNPEAAIREAERAINDLKFKGIYTHSNINGKPLDSPEFLPLWEMMARCNLPVYIHPWRSDKYSEYPVEETSRYNIASIFGWPYETTAAMTRFVCSGILEKFPDLKIITHHGGGMVPYFQQRIHQHYGLAAGRPNGGYLRALSKPVLDYYRLFYNDTAIHGNTAALMCLYDFCGADHIIFGCDMPLGDYYFGGRSYRQTINAIEAMPITPEEKQKILRDNIIRLLRLPL